jgi:hypothetical protein
MFEESRGVFKIDAKRVFGGVECGGLELFLLKMQKKCC